MSAPGVSRIQSNEMAPFIGQVFFRVDCRHWADWHTRCTANAIFGVDKKLGCSRKLAIAFDRMNAVDWAGVNTRGIFCADAGLGDHISHKSPPDSGVELSDHKIIGR
jgi:hypothetical protein